MPIRIREIASISRPNSYHSHHGKGNEYKKPDNLIYTEYIN
jgi:hypothetical protein